VAASPDPEARGRCRRAPLPLAGLLAIGALAIAAPAAPAASVFVSTGNPDALMAIASRPAATGVVETEAADDFVLTDATAIDGASFTGLLTGSATPSDVQQLVVEVYRVFPQDSDAGRIPQVPTRANSPSDVAFATREASSSGLTFTGAVLNPNFTANNSVDNGIHPKPNQTTGGEGQVTGTEVGFNVAFDPPIALPAGHWFLVPQVGLSGTGHFYWLSAPKPIVAPGTPFTPDLQAWVRNADLAPDWLRVGTDVVGGSPAPTFNAAFTVSGHTCSQPLTIAPAALPAGTAGQPYQAKLTASGGLAPYGFTETGALPAGISFAADGTLSGTPTGGAGTFPIVVTASDAIGCTGIANRTLTIGPAPTGSVPPGPGSGSGAGTTSVAAPPRIAHLKLSPAAFRAASRGASFARRHAPRRPVGTTVTYTDSRAARTTLTVLEPIRGVRRGHSCRPAARGRHGARCTLYRALGHATHADAAGANRLRFSGRLNGRKLAPGSYRLSLTPRAGSLTGGTVSAGFRILH
jgi:hypothetical protein